MVCIVDLGSYVIGLFKEPIIGSLKFKMSEIRHLENRYDVIFFCRRWSDLDKNFGDWCRMICRRR